MPRTRSARGDLPPITRGVVLEAAVRIARAHGVEALSVRRVAGELDVWPTTIYHHVGGTKDGLLAHTADTIAAQLELPAPDARPWHETLEEIARSLRHGIAEYRGLASHLLTAAAPGPHAQRIMERLLEVLVEHAELSVTDAFDAYQALTGYVLTQVQRDERGATAERIARYVELGGEADLPLTARVAQLVPADPDERFDRGLDIVIGGIAALR